MHVFSSKALSFFGQVYTLNSVTNEKKSGLFGAVRLVGVLFKMHN